MSIPVANLRKLIFGQSELSEERVDDEFLERFLSVAGNDKNGNPDVSKAFEVYSSYFSVLNALPVLNPKKKEYNYQHALKVLLDFVSTPDQNPLHFYGFDNKNRAILGYITSQVDPRKPDVLLGQLLASVVIVEYLQQKFNAHVKKYGMIMVMDHSGMTLQHYHTFLTNPTMLRLFAEFYCNAIPIVIHQQGVLNEAKTTNLLFMLARPFLAKEMVDKIEFYGCQHENIITELGGIENTPDFILGGVSCAKPWPSEIDLNRYLKQALPSQSSNKLDIN